MSDILQRICDAYSRNPAEALKLLPELMDAIGKTVIELPVEIGNTVYVVAGAASLNIVEAKVIEITLKENGISYVRLYSTDDRIADYHYSNFCKTVFLTRSEAESALAERKSNE